MIADLKRYPEYKESGLPWLGDIPEHWASERAKWLFTKMDRPVRDVDEVVTCFRDGVVTLRKNRRLRGFTEATFYSGYQGIRKGDLVIHGMDAFAGAIGVSDSDGKGTPVYNVCHPMPGVSASYYAYLVRQMSQSQWVLALAKGIRERSTDFRFETFGNQRVPLPPPDEQATIVRFLDWANGRLERAIRAKRKVIALLNEQKQAIIHRAVTRGLDPSVPLKPSGIPWLGDIPQHWEVRKVRTVADLFVSNVDKHSKANETGVRLCNYVDVYKNDTINERLAFMQATATIDEIERFRIRVGDVIITKDSEEWDDIGVPSLVTYEADDLVCGYHLAILRHRPERITGAFLHRVLEDRFVATQMHVRAKGVTRYGLGHSAIKDVLLPLPPVLEQQTICKRLKADLEAFVVATTRLEGEIELLREYRTRLVADVVTGKLDVCEAAARLPDEAPLDTIEDDADLDDETESADAEAAV